MLSSRAVYVSGAGSVLTNAPGAGQVPSYLSYRKLGEATKDY
jgi:hypothetical protein